MGSLLASMNYPERRGASERFQSMKWKLKLCTRCRSMLRHEEARPGRVGVCLKEPHAHEHRDAMLYMINERQKHEMAGFEQVGKENEASAEMLSAA